jgi:hypothetical protein
MTWLARCVVFQFVAAALLLSQSLRVLPSRTDLKTPGALSLTMDSPTGNALTAIQWEFSFPPAIEIKLSDIAIGKAAEAARKSLTCSLKGTDAAGSRRMRYACILAGGQSPIGNGPIVVVQYRAQWDVKGAPVRVAIENILGVSADLRRIPIPNMDATIDIE